MSNDTLSSKIKRLLSLKKNHPDWWSWVLSYKIKKKIDLNDYDVKDEVVLIIAHDNSLLTIGGVEQCTLQLVSHLISTDSRKPPFSVLLYFFDQKRNGYQALLIDCRSRKLQTIFQLSNDDFENTQLLVSKFKIKACLVEHMMRHDLKSLYFIHNLKIPLVIFVHDYYLLTKVADLVIDGQFQPLSYFKSKVDTKDWQNQVRYFFEKEAVSDYDLKIIFNSEFTLGEYQKWWGHDHSPRNWFISYPDI